MISFFSYIYAPATILFFFFNDTATTEIYTLSLHDALPIWRSDPLDLPFTRERDGAAERGLASFELPREAPDDRSEEHTSELSHLVISYAVFCLKKKKKNQTRTILFSQTHHYNESMAVASYL